jgi:hypothetical protein
MDGVMSLFGTTRDFGVRKPTIGSLSAAQAEFNHWLNENTFENLTDASGAHWVVEARLQQGPGPIAYSGPWFVLKVCLKCDVTLEGLIETQVLSEKEDGRLVKILESNRHIPELRIVLGQWEDASLNGITAKFRSIIGVVKSNWPKRSFGELKRRHLGRWIEQNSCFATKVSKSREKA